MLGLGTIEWGIIGTLGTALVTALGLYLREARKLSGRIDTSEAAILWAESAALRADCREQLRLANMRIALLENRVNELENANAMLSLDNHELRRQVARLEFQLKGGNDAR